MPFPKMSVCPICGKQLTFGAKYCTRCGNEFMIPDSDPVEIPRLTQPRNVGWVMILALSAFIIALAMTLWVVTKTEQSADQKPLTQVIPSPTSPISNVGDMPPSLPPHVLVGEFIAPIPPPDQMGATRAGWSKLVDLTDFVPKGYLDRYNYTISIPTGYNIWVCENGLWQEAYGCPRNDKEMNKNTTVPGSASNFKFKTNPLLNPDPSEEVKVKITLDLKK